MSLKCVTNRGYVVGAAQQACAIRRRAAAETALQAAQLLWNIRVRGLQGDDQKKLADTYLDMAKRANKHQKLFLDKEDDLGNEVFGVKDIKTDYDTFEINLASGFENLADGVKKEFKDFTQEYCLCDTACLDVRMANRLGLYKADITSNSMRQAEALATVDKDKLFARKYQLLALGRGALVDIPGFAAIRGAVSATQGDLLKGIIGGAIGFASYYLTPVPKPVAYKPVDYGTLEPLRIESKPVTPVKVAPEVLPGGTYTYTDKENWVGL